jgi:4-oxalocrotonate tautomerase
MRVQQSMIIPGYRCAHPGYRLSHCDPNAATQGATMPEVYVHAVEGRTPEQKKALMKDITEAVVKNFGTPADAVVVTIVESQKINKAKAGVPFTER